MDASKGLQQSIGRLIVFGFLFIFPFGQLLRLELRYGESTIPLLLIDFFSAACLIIVPFVKKPRIFSSFNNFIIICLFSLLFSCINLNFNNVLLGSLYLLRLVGYFSFFVLTWNLVKNDNVFREKVINVLIITLIFTTLLGWIQYLLFPDLISLKNVGWDDHLGRLVGTFLDPGFTSVILLIGFLVSLYSFLNEKKMVFLFISIFFIISLALTYSRAGYVAFVVGILTVVFLTRKFIILAFVVFFLLVLTVLPRGLGEGVRLERTASVEARFKNYAQTWEIFFQNPIFGVGYNNICLYRVGKFGEDPKSHACGGADSSLLFVLATTGVTGFIVFVNLLLRLFRSIGDYRYGDLVKTVLVSLGVGSLFANVIFYPFILGIMAILIAIGLKE